jgi:FMN-dependent NADH-azoreductase
MRASFSGAIMQRLLYVKASIFGDDGQSSQLARRFLERFAQAHDDATVVARDVQNPAIPHLDATTYAAFGKPAEALTSVDRELLRLSDALIAELEAADALVIAMPLYNFGVPSAFKAWIDHVARAQRTFRYTAQGPEGLLGNIRRCWVVASRGGQYQGTPRENQVPYLTTMLGFLGIAPPQFVFAEGLLRPDYRDAALAGAQRAIEQLAL